MTSNPFVSIIIPVHNGEQYVAAAIDSAFAQTYTNFELIIINDGSTDNSRAIIAPYCARPNVHCFEQPNRGVAAARNTALRHARGEFIAFLDQDDLWLPQKLERQVRYLVEHPQVALVHAYQAYTNEAGEEIANPKDWVAPLEGDCFAELFNRNRIAVLTVLLRKRCLEQVGMFNETIPGADDYELWLRLARRFPFGFMPEAVARYRIHGSNVSHNLFKMTLRELQALESVLGGDSSVRTELGNKRVNRRLSPLNYAAGAWTMWQERDFGKARAFFRKALKQYPLHWPSWKGFVWCSLTSSQRKALEWYGHRLKNLVTARRIH